MASIFENFLFVIHSFCILVFKFAVKNQITCQYCDRREETLRREESRQRLTVQKKISDHQIGLFDSPSRESKRYAWFPISKISEKQFEFVEFVAQGNMGQIVPMTTFLEVQDTFLGVQDTLFSPFPTVLIFPGFDKLLPRSL